MKLTEKHIRRGFWYWDVENNFPPKAISHFEDYNSSSILHLTSGQSSSPQRKKIIQKWCEMLPELDRISYLWLNMKVGQDLFESVCEISNLEGLYINSSGIKDISSLRKLTNLNHLYLGHLSQIVNIDILAELSSLITLDLEQINKISDFGFISNLPQLEGLSIDGGMWVTQKIDTLEPVGHLLNLKYLTLINTRIKDKSFAPLLNLKNLIRFNTAWFYPEEEFEKLKALPNLKYGNIETSWNESKEKLHKHLAENTNLLP